MPDVLNIRPMAQLYGAYSQQGDQAGYIGSELHNLFPQIPI